MNRIFIGGAGILGLILMMTASGQAKQATQISKLTCDASQGIENILIGKESILCDFKAGDGLLRAYSGLERYGLDIAQVEEVHLAWVVTVRRPDVEPESLAGTYASKSSRVLSGEPAKPLSCSHFRSTAA